MALTRSSLPSMLEPGLNTIFDQMYGEYANEYQQVFDVDTSKKAFEEDTLIYGLGALQEKGEGAGVAYDEGGEAWTSRYVHKTYALAFSVTEEAIEDNLYFEVSSKYTKYLARSVNHTKDIEAALILNRAFNSSYTGGDGKELCATDHPLAGGGTHSNELTTPADLSEASIEQMLIDIRNADDDRGIPAALTGQKLIIPAELMFVATRLLESMHRPGTQDNDVNAIQAMGMLPDGFCVITRLTDTDAWFIKTNAMDGLRWFDRVEVSRKGEGDFETGNWRYKTRTRFSVGWTDWRAIWGSPGA